MRKTFLLVTVLVCLSLFTLDHAASAHTIDLPILLKVNQFYVLYTHPKAPYLNEQDRLMVPLSMFCRRLMGADVEYDSRSRTATVVFHQDRLVLTVGSKVASIDGKPFQVDATPVIEGGYIFVPLRMLCEGFDITVTWNKKHHYIALNDERLMNTSTVLDLVDSSPGQTANGDAFVPLSSRLIMEPKTDGFTRVQLDVTARNITGTDVPAGMEDLHPYIVYNTGYSHDPGYSHEGEPGRTRPPIKAGETFKRTMYNDFPTASDKINCILLWCRTVLLRG